MSVRIAIRPRHDSSGKKDVTHAFAPEARAWEPDALFVFDNTRDKPARRAEVHGYLQQVPPSPSPHVAFFSHGFARGLQTGHDLKTAGQLADALAKLTTNKNICVTLYACDAADAPKPTAPGGDGGFADALRDELALRGVTGHVDAHVTTGHTTKNPYVRRFYSDGKTTAVGGNYLVAPGSPLWRRWVAALKGPLRFQFPQMTEGDIEAALK